jgi:cytochrome c-type biogenesis protein CcmH/NrfG
MFFPKLRRQAKWMFLFLALVFGIGFIGFGVGAGGVGVGNIFEGVAGGGPSVGDAEERVAENPRDAQAYRDLATAHQTDANTDEAIEALENFVRLKPKNVDALNELAGLYLVKAQEAQQAANLAYTRASFIAPGAAVASTFVIDGQPLDPDPISEAVNSALAADVSTHQQEVQLAYSQAVDVHRRITVATPKDTGAYLLLAETAVQAGDVTTAIDAYEKFLKLAPNDPSAGEIRRTLRTLRAQAQPTSG